MGHDLPGVANSFTTDRPLAWFVWKTMNSISRAVPEVALQAIRKLIAEQGFGPGDALPSQRDLAVQLGVSRASLREALSSLSALGVISVQPGKGVFVQASVELPQGEAVPGWPFAAQASPLEIFQLRYALEGFAAGLAAVTLTIDELDSLEDNVEAMRKVLKTGDFEAAARLDFEFHQRILQASGNQAMVSILSASAEVFLESQKLPFIRAERAMETWQEHRKILRALARRASGEPVAYLVGEKEFYGRAFTVTAAVLIPRPETEELVSWIWETTGKRELKMLDWCTGSGCIALALKNRNPLATVFAYDVSPEALAIAKENARQLSLDVTLELNDALEPVFREKVDLL